MHKNRGENAIRYTTDKLSFVRSSTYTNNIDDTVSTVHMKWY